MNILLLGSGAREHALAWKMAQSTLLNSLYIAPGNPGTAALGTNVDLDICDFHALGEFSLANDISMIVVGPEAPLVQGIYDFFQNERYCSVSVIGPSQYAAKLEGSKDFAKQFMMRQGIPTAQSFTVTESNLEEGLDFLETMTAPYVLKADGLAAGKGVLILNSIDEAQRELKEMIAGKFGSASHQVVIEEFLSGIELSVFVMVDGNDYKILPEAKDYKRIGVGDTGLNTGGMGAVSPVPFADEKFMKKVLTRIILPTLEGFRKENIDYKGFIFIGIIKCAEDPYVIEYNVRLGDPETEAILLRIESDFVDLLQGVATGTLAEKELVIDSRATATIFTVAGGYPETYESGKRITGLELIKDSLVFHAGTQCDEHGHLVTAGGRVIAISSYGNNKEEALAISSKNAKHIQYDRCYYREDIGFDL